MQWGALRRYGAAVTGSERLGRFLARLRFRLAFGDLAVSERSRNSGPVFNGRIRVLQLSSNEFYDPL